MSEIRATTISDAAGTGPITLTGQSAAKAWVSFNGTGAAAIVTSQNISSLTDNATGDYRVFFTNSFSAEQATVASKWNSASNLSDNINMEGVLLASQKVVSIENGSATDPNRMRMITVGDLA